MHFFDYSYLYTYWCLEGNFIPFIEGDRAYIDEDYLIQAHTLKKGPNDSLIFFYLGYTNEIPLPNAEFHLYNCHSLTNTLVPREGGRRHRSSGLPGRMTRSRTRREQSQHHRLNSHITHISMRPVVRHGTVPALRSGHGRHQVAGPLVPAPMEPRTSSDGHLRPEVSVPSPSS